MPLIYSICCHRELKKTENGEDYWLFHINSILKWRDQLLELAVVLLVIVSYCCSSNTQAHASFLTYLTSSELHTGATFHTDVIMFLACGRRTRVWVPTLVGFSSASRKRRKPWWPRCSGHVQILPRGWCHAGCPTDPSPGPRSPKSSGRWWETRSQHVTCSAHLNLVSWLTVISLKSIQKNQC